MDRLFNSLSKEHEWEQIIANRKNAGVILFTDDEFDCQNCGATIDFEDYLSSDESECCPFCGEYIVPYH